MKDVKQIATYLAAKAEAERKWEFEKSLKRMDWTTAAAVSGTAAAGALAATKERTGKMAAIGGGVGLLAWMLYDYLKQPGVPEGGPVKYSTGNWLLDRRLAAQTIENNYTRRIDVMLQAYQNVAPEVRARHMAFLQQFVQLKAEQVSKYGVLREASAEIVPSEVRERSASLLSAMVTRANTTTSSGPGDSFSTAIKQTTSYPTSASASSGPGDSVYRTPDGTSLSVGVKPSIEDPSTVRTQEDRANRAIRNTPEVKATDQPLAVQTDQGTINAIAQEIQKGQDSICQFDPNAAGCLTEEEIYLKAKRMAELNARRRMSGEPANWLHLLVTHGQAVKQVSLQWMMWKDLLTPWTVDKYHTIPWYAARAEPPPPVGDVGVKDLTYGPSRVSDNMWLGRGETGGVGYGWLGTGIPGNTAIRIKEWSLEHYKTSAPPSPIPRSNMLENMAYQLWVDQPVPWCCSYDAFMREGQEPRTMVTRWMSRTFSPFGYKTKEGKWVPRIDGSYWGFDKYPGGLARGHAIKVPQWWRDEFKRTKSFSFTDAAYFDRVREYYKTSYYLVWAGIVYCLHAHKPIPSWYRKHALFHGVPCPSKKMEEMGRNFATCPKADLDELEQLASDYRKQTGTKLPLEAFCPLPSWKKLNPVPIGLDGSGAGAFIPRAKVEEMLSLVVKHTPVPGAVTDEIRKYQRRLPDWPRASTGAMRPDLGLPPWWADFIQSKKTQAELDRDKRNRIGMKIYSGAMSAIAGMCSAGVASSITSAATSQVSSQLANQVISSVVKSAINAAFTLMSDMQASALEGRGFGFKEMFLPKILAVATSAAGPILETTVEGASNELAKTIEGIESEVKAGIGKAWQHTWSLIGDVSDQYSTIMKAVTDDVPGFIARKGEAAIGGILNGVADEAVAGIVAKYSQVDSKYLTMGVNEIMDKAETYLDTKFEEELPGRVSKKMKRIVSEASELEASAKVMMDF